MGVVVMLVPAIKCLSLSAVLLTLGNGYEACIQILHLILVFLVSRINMTDFRWLD